MTTTTTPTDVTTTAPTTCATVHEVGSFTLPALGSFVGDDVSLRVDAHSVDGAGSLTLWASEFGPADTYAHPVIPSVPEARRYAAQILALCDAGPASRPPSCASRARAGR